MQGFAFMQVCLSRSVEALLAPATWKSGGRRRLAVRSALVAERLVGEPAEDQAGLAGVVGQSKATVLAAVELPRR